jgi:glycosyltransferase involved in cell wall biosynthesis
VTTTFIGASSFSSADDHIRVNGVATVCYLGLMRRDPRIAMAAHAKLGEGGQGVNLLHMSEAIRAFGEVAILDASNIPASRQAAIMGRVPLLQRRHDLLTLAGDVSFDSHVARRLPDGEIFVGVAGQCARTMKVAGSRGMRRVLDVLNHHIDEYAEHVERECRKFGIPTFIHPRMRERTIREYEMADAIRTLSEVCARSLSDRGVARSKIFVARPHVTLSDFPIARFEDPVFRVAYAGLVSPWKGFHLLIEAFDRLRLPNSELVIWGGTGSRATARFVQDYQAQNPTIHLRPVGIRSVGYEEVYGKASVLVHPSLSDGYPYVVVEAMASGLPVVATSACGATDLFRDGENGFVIPPGDVRAIEERLEFLYHHRDKLPQMGARARATAGTLTLESFRTQLAPAILGSDGARSTRWNHPTTLS